MSNNTIFNHYCEVIDSLIDNYDYFKLYFQHPESMGDIDLDDVKLRFGISKGCIIADNDFVVKFNLSDYTYCDKEEWVYDAAKSQDLSYYLTECFYLGEYKRTIKTCDINEQYCPYFNCDIRSFVISNEHQVKNITICIPLYCYKKVDIIWSDKYHNDDFEKGCPLDSYTNSPIGQRNWRIAEKFIELYGEEEFNRFTEFCEDYEIADLHSGNCGFINDKLVFLDYSGFEDEYY